MLKNNLFLVTLYDEEGTQIEEISTRNIVQFGLNVDKNETTLNLIISLLTSLIESDVFRKIKYAVIDFYDNNGEVINNKTYYVKDFISQTNGNLLNSESNFLSYNLKLTVVDSDDIDLSHSMKYEQNNEKKNE